MGLYGMVFDVCCRPPKMWVKGALPVLSPLDEGLGTWMYVTQAMSPYNHLDK